MFWIILFSTFGIVQNKLCNRFDNQKTEKIVKSHQLLKSSNDVDVQMMTKSSNVNQSSDWLT